MARKEFIPGQTQLERTYSAMHRVSISTRWRPFYVMSNMPSPKKHHLQVKFQIVSNVALRKVRAIYKFTQHYKT